MSMGFCAKCGTQLNESGACLCGYTSASQQMSNLLNTKSALSRINMKLAYLLGSCAILLRALFHFIDYIRMMVGTTQTVFGQQARVGGNVWGGLSGMFVMLATTVIYLILFRLLCDWLVSWYNKK